MAGETAKGLQDLKKPSFRLSDLVWIICFVGLAVLLIIAAIYLWETWQASPPSWRLLGR